jgi:hypothetical protein
MMQDRAILKQRLKEQAKGLWLLFNFFKKSKSAPAKPSLDDVDLDLPEIPGAVEIIDGFPRVHWSRVRKAAEVYAKHPALDQIWTELAAQWLGIVSRQLGGDYRICESDHLLSAQVPQAARHLLEIGDAAYNRLAGLLRRESHPRGMGKHAILLFDTTASYYDYISYFYAETDRGYGASSGVHISRGYRHTAINNKSSAVLRTLVHELAHDMVDNLPLPRWLNEGIAQFSEDLVPGYRAPIIDSAAVRLQRRYWSWFGIDHFWNGRGFLLKPSQRVSYQLAEVLFRNLCADRNRRAGLGEFIGSAHRDDAGAAACEKCFGVSLAELVEEFLGPGDWEPHLKKSENFVSRPDECRNRLL